MSFETIVKSFSGNTLTVKSVNGNEQPIIGWLCTFVHTSGEFVISDHSDSSLTCRYDDRQDFPRSSRYYTLAEPYQHLSRVLDDDLWTCEFAVPLKELELSFNLKYESNGDEIQLQMIIFYAGPETRLSRKIMHAIESLPLPQDTPNLNNLIVQLQA